MSKDELRRLKSYWNATKFIVKHWRWAEPKWFNAIVSGYCFGVGFADVAMGRWVWLVVLCVLALLNLGIASLEASTKAAGDALDRQSNALQVVNKDTIYKL